MNTKEEQEKLRARHVHRTMRIMAKRRRYPEAVRQRAADALKRLREERVKP